MPRTWLFALLTGGILSAVGGEALAQPNETVIQSDQVLAEIMAIPARGIPERLLAEAQGVAIIPDVLKVGFIAGAARAWRGADSRC